MWFLRKILRILSTEKNYVVRARSGEDKSFDEKWKVRTLILVTKGKIEVKQILSKNYNTTRCIITLAGKKHCGEVCRHERSRTTEEE